MFELIASLVVPIFFAAMALWAFGAALFILFDKFHDDDGGK